MVNLYDSYRQSSVMNMMPDNSAALAKAASSIAEQDAAYSDRMDKMLGDLHKSAGISILSEPDKQRYYSEFQSANADIQNVLQDPSLDNRTKYRAISSRINQFTNNPVIQDIMAGSKFAEESLKKIADPRFAEGAQNMVRNWDTESMGRFSTVFNDKFSWKGILDKVNNALKPMSFNAKGEVDLYGEFTGITDSMVIDHITRNALTYYTDESGAKSYYDVIYSGLSDEERFMKFAEDLNNQIPRHQKVSDIGMSNFQSNLRVREAAIKDANRPTDKDEFNLPTVMATSYASRIHGIVVDRLRRIIETNNGTIKDSEGNDITADVAKMANSPENSYALMAFFDAIDTKQTMYPVMDLNSQESLYLSNTTSAPLSGTSSRALPTTPRSFNPILLKETIDGDMVEYVPNQEAIKALRNAVSRGQIRVNDASRGRYRLTMTPSNTVGAVVPVTFLSGAATVDFLKAMANEATSSSSNPVVMDREMISRAVSNLVADRRIKASGPSSVGPVNDRFLSISITPSELYEASNATVGRDKNKELLANNLVGYNIIIHGVVNTGTARKPNYQYNFELQAPISQEQFDPYGQGSSIASFGKMFKGSQLTTRTARP